MDLREVFHALSDDVRLDIVASLARSEDDLACRVLNRGLPRSTASYHFKTLREAGLISQYDQGNLRMNHLERDAVEALAPGLVAAVAASPAGVERPAG